MKKNPEIEKFNSTHEEKEPWLELKPGDIDISMGLVGSQFRKSETETIVINIIIISKQNDNEWLNFTFEKYKEACSHIVTSSERSFLNLLESNGYLSLDNETYSVDPSFLKALHKFAK